VDLPLIVDIDTGFGNALNVRHTIRHVERAGADAVQMEDQQMPKRCGHLSGKSLVEPAVMVSKLRAATAARADRSGRWSGRSRSSRWPPVPRPSAPGSPAPRSASTASDGRADDR
jgi:hypothetical protein